MPHGELNQPLLMKKKTGQSLPDDLMFSGGQCGGGHRAQITSRAGDENLQYLFLRSLNLCVYVGGIGDSGC
jgi:hypothetical protein